MVTLKMSDEDSKLLVNVKDNVPSVLISTTPKPYPQLLVIQ